MSITSGLDDSFMAALESEAEALELRAATNADREFLLAVFTSTRLDEFARSGLSGEEIAVLLEQQFTMQDRYYRRHYPQARFDVVLCEGMAAGRLYHDWQDAGLRVMDIALLPAFRGRRIGTRLMRALIGQAAQRGMAAQLYVESDNPVRSLYRRLGFEKTGENGIYELMCRPAAPFEAVAE